MHRIVNGQKVPFTEEEVAARLAAESEMLSKSVLHCRQQEYGSLGDQLGMLFDELKQFGTIAKDGQWFQHIQAVKDRHPKGEA